LVRVIPLVCAASLTYSISVSWRNQPYPVGHEWSLARAAAQSELEQRTAKQLVIVRYSPAHIYHYEWVYNAADIDGAKVVWARSLGPEKDARLLDYFKDREIWYIAPDVNPRRLVRQTARRRRQSPNLARQ
jgi:hypothetical protein